MYKDCFWKKWSQKMPFFLQFCDETELSGKDAENRSGFYCRIIGFIVARARCDDEMSDEVMSESSSSRGTSRLERLASDESLYRESE